MTRRKESLGRLELDVLRYVTDHHPISVREVAAHFAETSGYARTTLLTVMERLRAKSYLTRRRVEGRHRYTPTVAKADLLHGMVADFVIDVLGGNVSPFVAYLTRSSKLNDDEIRKLEQLLKRLEAREQKDKP
jgi:predicted transcriptional regulator